MGIGLSPRTIPVVVWLYFDTLAPSKGSGYTQSLSVVEQPGAWRTIRLIATLYRGWTFDFILC